jgi:hypothetical protein
LLLQHDRVRTLGTLLLAGRALIGILRS